MRKPYQILEIAPRVVDSRKGYTGACTHCGGKATKEAHFKQDGIVVVERYCDECVKPETWDRIQAVYSRFD